MHLLLTLGVVNWPAPGCVLNLEMAYPCTACPDLLHTAQRVVEQREVGAEAGIVELLGWQMDHSDMLVMMEQTVTGLLE